MYGIGARLPHDGNVYGVPDDARFAAAFDGGTDDGAGLGQGVEYLCNDRYGGGLLLLLLALLVVFFLILEFIS